MYASLSLDIGPDIDVGNIYRSYIYIYIHAYGIVCGLYYFELIEYQSGYQFGDYKLYDTSETVIETRDESIVESSVERLGELVE